MDCRLPALRATPDAQPSCQDTVLDRAGQAEAGGADPYGPSARLPEPCRDIAGRRRAGSRRAGDRGARPVIRLATAADRDTIEAIVREAYSIYIERIGKPPGPMLDDYAALIKAGVVS